MFFKIPQTVISQHSSYPVLYQRSLEIASPVFSGSSQYSCITQLPLIISSPDAPRGTISPVEGSTTLAYGYNQTVSQCCHVNVQIKVVWERGIPQCGSWYSQQYLTSGPHCLVGIPKMWRGYSQLFHKLSVYTCWLWIFRKKKCYLQKVHDTQVLTVISFMFMSVCSLFKISGGQGEPAMMPEHQNKDNSNVGFEHICKHSTVCVCVCVCLHLNVLPASIDDKSYLCKSGWLSMSVNIVGVP